MTRREIEGWSLRWDEERAQAARREGWWRDETLADLVPRLAAAEPDRLMLVEGEVRLSVGELHERALRLGTWLGERVAPGGVVSFMLPNWHEAATIYLAATYAGLVANPILPSLRTRDTTFILRDCKSRVVFVPETFRRFDYAAMLTAIAAEMEHGPEIVVVRGTGPVAGTQDYAAILEASAPRTIRHPDPDAVRMVMYTSGTTGRPKGVLHTHNSLGALLHQIGAYWHVAPGDRFLVASPISHIGGSIYAFEGPVLLGSVAVLLDQWNAQEALRRMQEERITHMAGATPFLEQILRAAQAQGDHLDALKVFICGGASVPPALIEEANAWFTNARVSRVYGSTEVPVTTVGSLDEKGMPEAAQTDGKAGIAQVILAPDGEIRARGPQMLAGYIRQEDEEGAFDAAGFYRSGDQGALDAGGFLTVTGRIKDLIIRNGENIAPKEIEDLLSGHPAIADIAIVGLPDPRTGERACAVIVPSDGAIPDVPMLADYLSAAGVTRFKYPEQVVLREALPRNEAGKVLKHVLRAELAEMAV
ncbi:AMP-binding protein [Novosphingobium sp. MBES04]|uniref:AMP-binding protein n=1 Tax=Novosphingobium sp. MBES04 TaxID=1206458 RepID=UPI00069397A5|nr:AMP-binding protein [Novosphingobium sp. MBES04]GAM04285.1 4-coumarate--CoA ligase-like 3-like [Novosphingobium sp. MBES04]